MQLKTVYTDVPASVLYDVLHDPDYRRTWDKFMMEAQEIGYLNPNNSVSYYACECTLQNPAFTTNCVRLVFIWSLSWNFFPLRNERI